MKICKKWKKIALLPAWVNNAQPEQYCKILNNLINKILNEVQMQTMHSANANWAILQL